ncbi:hypothetical protein ACOCG7_05915 [Paraburkholderia sp. DD10]|uniref:hypothetical protein n=1 Tax=Paraburkholderia sp. DD10 TaxID=3409691 RepID=UPI003BA25D52
MTTVTPKNTTIARTLLYRPDIDGLRAVAVLAVVLFHAFPSLLPGGFCPKVLLVARHPAAAFFSPVSRFWKLLVGALLAHWNRTQLYSDAAASNRMSIVGAVLCGLAMAGLNKDMDFPGWCPINRNGTFLYSYGDHISDSANRLIADQLLAGLHGSSQHEAQY